MSQVGATGPVFPQVLSPDGVGSTGAVSFGRHLDRAQPGAAPAYASTDETAPRQAIAEQLRSVLARIGQKPAGAAPNGADASLQAVAGDLLHALGSYDPHSASVTRSLRSAANALSAAVDARNRGDAGALGRLQDALAQALPGQESVDKASAANKGVIADILQDVGTAGRGGGTRDGALSAEAAQVLGTLTGQAAGLTGLASIANRMLTGIAGDLLHLSANAGGNPAARQALQAAMSDLKDAADGGGEFAVGRLGADVARLSAAMGGKTAPLQDNLETLQHVTSLAAQPAPGAAAGGVAGPFRTAENTVSCPDAAQWKAREGRFWGATEQCAALTQHFNPQLGATQGWEAGEKVKGNLNIRVGTPIATFNFERNGKLNYGPADHPGGWYGVSHTGLYMGQNAQGVLIFDQWRGKDGGAGIHLIPWDKWGSSGDMEAGDKYHVVKQPGMA